VPPTTRYTTASYSFEIDPQSVPMSPGQVKLSTDPISLTTPGVAGKPRPNRNRRGGRIGIAMRFDIGSELVGPACIDGLEGRSFALSPERPRPLVSAFMQSEDVRCGGGREPPPTFKFDAALRQFGAARLRLPGLSGSTRQRIGVAWRLVRRYRENSGVGHSRRVNRLAAVLSKGCC